MWDECTLSVPKSLFSSTNIPSSAAENTIFLAVQTGNAGLVNIHQVLRPGLGVDC